MFARPQTTCKTPPRATAHHPRGGKTLVLIVVLLPSMLAVLGLVTDGGLLWGVERRLQDAADAASTAAAFALRDGQFAATAATVARQYIADRHGLPDAAVTVNIPPTSGPFAGRADYVGVEVTQTRSTYISKIIDGLAERDVSVYSVAGVDDATAPAAIVVLDPNPASLAVLGIGGLPSLPAIRAGLEIEGVGQLTVDGAVLVNTGWGGLSQHHKPCGLGFGPPYSIACMPLLPTTQLRAVDIRCAGGVDNPNHYGALDPAADSPLKTDRLLTHDPFGPLPPPSTASDAANVSTLYRGGVTVAGLPLIGPPATLHPGVYDWIDVVSGIVHFSPGVYIIRGRNPVTNLSLSLVAAEVQALGVLFYITNSAGYDASSGAPDASDGDDAPAGGGVGSLLPSAVVNNLLLGSNITGLDDPASPYDGMVIYQRRHDRRPIVVAQTSFLSTGGISGQVYAKWGHVALLGDGQYDLSIVAGTARVITLGTTHIAPQAPLPPARDVYLVE